MFRRPKWSMGSSRPQPEQVFVLVAGVNITDLEVRNRGRQTGKCTAYQITGITASAVSSCAVAGCGAVGCAGITGPCYLESGPQAAGGDGTEQHLVKPGPGVIAAKTDAVAVCIDATGPGPGGVEGEAPRRVQREGEVRFRLPVAQRDITPWSAAALSGSADQRPSPGLPALQPPRSVAAPPIPSP